jgi:hypothetical protein
VNSDTTKQDWAGELWPEDGPDLNWPDDWPASGWPDVAHRPYGSGVPPVGVGSGTRGLRGLALGLTFAVALCAGAGYFYKSELAGSASAATSPSQGTTIGGGPVTGATAGAGSVENVMALGRVLAVGHDSVTVGGGPGRAINAHAMSATQFTGIVRSLARVRVGEAVTAQITVSDGVATLVRLRDPASQP